MKIIGKIQRKLLKLRLQPIRVFCFHQVSAVFDPTTMWECDWTEIEQFKRNILKLMSEYEFIPLQGAYEKLNTDIFRHKKYAVLTSDDGWASLKEILPWLNEQKIPVTLFLNPYYFEEGTHQGRDSDCLLRSADLEYIVAHYPLVTFGSHGWKHMDALTLNNEEFLESVRKSVYELKKYSNYIPYFAFTYGRCRSEEIEIVKDEMLCPVMIRGNVNYQFCRGGSIDRELIDGKLLC